MEQQATSHRHRRSLQRKLASAQELEIAHLTQMSELELQREVIEPLLKKIGFRNVYDNSGPEERGKDLIATTDEFGREYLWAIQIKKFRATAKAASTDSFGFLLNQLRQALQETILHPQRRVRCRPDKCLFITPYPLGPTAMEHYEERLKEDIFRALRIIDGVELADLVQRHLPEVVARFSVEMQYRLAVASDVNAIKESSVAFERTHLELSSIYVDVGLGEGSELLQRIAAIPIGSRLQKDLQKVAESGFVAAKERDLYIATPTEKQAHRFRVTFEKWAQVALVSMDGKSPTPGSHRQISVDLIPFIQGVQTVLKEHFSALSRIPLPEVSVEECGRIARDAMLIEKRIRTLQRMSFVEKHCPQLTRPEIFTKDLGVPISIPSSSLIKVPVSLFVIGPPGTGKTTLLRRIAHMTALDRNGPLPIFVPLIAVPDATQQGLVAFCLTQLVQQGYGSDPTSTRETLEQSLHAGQVRICFDGLDELGVNAPRMMRAIDDFGHYFRGCQLIVSCRDAFLRNKRNDLPQYWDGALTIGLLPFSPDQLALFVEEWFSAQPSARDSLAKWFRANPKMASAATTPIIAALLCSLYEVKSEMPATELDLYQRRYELLLGRWERAKGIPALPNDVRKRYEHYLMDVAHMNHCAERRSFTRREALEIGEEYVAKGFHHSVEDLVADCIHRGILEVDGLGGLSFGHLTYQEYLCAEYLAHENKVAFIIEVLQNPWWRKVLDFYAARKQNIGPLFEECSKRGLNGHTARRLLELAKFAPLTALRHINSASKLAPGVVFE